MLCCVVWAGVQLLGGVGLLLLAAALIWNILEFVKNMGKVTGKGRAVFITGCDTGFGRWVAESLHDQGFQVFAGCLQASGPKAQSLAAERPGITVVQVDVRDEQQIREARDTVVKNLGDNVLWSIFNNAGIHYMGDVELTPAEDFQTVMNINAMGTVRVTKAFLPELRKTTGSRVVNMTSVNGRVSFPFCCAYNMSKFAIESFSDTLRFEMKRFGVHVAIMEIGNFGAATGIIKQDLTDPRFKRMLDQMTPDLKRSYGEDYARKFPEMYESTLSTGTTDGTPVVKAICSAVKAKVPKCRYLVSGGNSILDKYTVSVFLVSILPSALMDRFLKCYFAPDHPLPAGATEA